MARPALALALLLAACADPAEAPPPAPAAEAPAPRGADAEPLAEAAPAVDLDELLAVRGDDGPFLRDLPEPQAARARPTENPHVEGQTDTVRTVVYDGIEVEAYEVAGGRTFVQRVAVTDPAYETASGLAVGRTRGAVESVLGVPVREEGGAAFYEIGDPAAPTAVEVRYETDGAGEVRATRIVWRPYVD